MNFKELHEIARQRGGKFLSAQGHFCGFECFHGHLFEMRPNLIKAGRWCPKCKKYHRMEEVCRVYLEHILCTKFPKCRPSWLVNESGNRIELDGYSEEHMIAFEYNGQQHYKKTTWYPDDDKLKQCKIHDAIKLEKCKEHGVGLVVITYQTKIEDLLGEIKCQLKALGVDIRQLNWSVPPLVDVYTNKIYLDRLRTDLLSKGFSLIDTKYRGETSKYKAICNVCGKERNTTPWTLRTKGCRNCSGKEKKTIEDAIKLAKSRGGYCTSTNYKNNRSKLNWICDKGHAWLASYNNIDKGNWCPECGKEKKKFSVIKSWNNRRITDNTKRLESIKSFAEQYNFTVVSQSYSGCDDPLIFLCENKHMWKIGTRAFKRAIKSGRGCTHCGPNTIKATRSK